MRTPGLLLVVAALVLPIGSLAVAAGRPAPGKPGYERAYVNDMVVTINAIEVPGKIPPNAQADLYEVVYPPDWKALGIAPPQCNPCDHDNNGIDAQDFHDHVLDSRPGDAGYRAPWHVFAIVPTYNGNPAHDAAVGALYKAHLPLTSEAALMSFLALQVQGGGPPAVKVDTDFYFLCAVVGGPHNIP